MTLTETETERCPCGEPLHYDDPQLEALVRQMILDEGPCYEMPLRGVVYSVPRHYARLHRIIAGELAALAEQYGWERTDRRSWMVERRRREINP